MFCAGIQQVGGPGYPRTPSKPEILPGVLEEFIGGVCTESPDFEGLHKAPQLLEVNGVKFFAEVVYFDPPEVAAKHGFNADTLPTRGFKIETDLWSQPLPYILYAYDETGRLKIYTDPQEYPTYKEENEKQAGIALKLIGDFVQGKEAGPLTGPPQQWSLYGEVPPLSKIISLMAGEAALKLVRSKVGEVPLGTDEHPGDVLLPEGGARPIFRLSVMDKALPDAVDQVDTLLSRAGYTMVEIVDKTSFSSSDGEYVQCRVEYIDANHKLQSKMVFLPSAVGESGFYYIPSDLLA